jgi:hypothetical protein
MDFKTMTIKDIGEWCVANGQVAWLKEEAKKIVDVAVYPRVKTADGKLKVDKSQEPTIEKRRITFVQLKTDFVQKFMPEIAPKAKARATTMFDYIDSL